MKIECLTTGDNSYIPDDQAKRIIGELIKEEKPNLDGEIRFIFIEDEYSRKINKQYLNHDYPTDVISFPFESTNQYVEGEVYVNVEQAAEQAADYKVSLEEEVWRLMIHGILHLLGENDSTSSEREKMRQKEDHYLAKFELLERSSE